MNLLKAEFDCEVLTPMFLSGVDQRSCELRAPSLRGAMRFWYRAMLGGRGLPLAEVKRKEAEVFGEPGRRIRPDAQDGGGQSAVLIRVSARDLNKHVKPPSDLPDWDSKPTKENPNGKLKPNSGIGYLWFSISLGQNLRSYVEPGTRFTVTMTAHPKREREFTEAMKAFWLLAHLGGLGTRARRAAGSFWVRGMRIEGVPDPPFRAYFDAGHVESTIKSWLEPKGNSTATFDRLGGFTRILHHSIGANDWENAVRNTGTALKNFRFDNRKARDSDRAGFGLPLTVGYQGDERKLSLSSQDNEDGRRASPLHMRIVPSLVGHSVRYDAVLTLLAGPFGPEGDSLVATYTGARGRQRNLPLPTLGLVQDYVNGFPDNEITDLL
jgi:CRISPR-associated protein Cmr1